MAKANLLAITAFSILFMLIANAAEEGINGTFNQTADLSSNLNITNSAESIKVINEAINATQEINESDTNQTDNSAYNESVNESVVGSNGGEGNIVQDNENNDKTANITDEINITNTTSIGNLSNIGSENDSIIKSSNITVGESQIIEPVDETLPADFEISEHVEDTEDFKEEHVTVGFGVYLEIVG